MFSKTQPADLAVFGGAPLFDTIRSISNLVQPDVEQFLSYSRTFFDTRQYTDYGPVEQQLEKRLAEFHDVEHCVSFAGGFWGLVLAMKCLALPGKTEVVMPSLTYRRLADIVAWAGLVPHFCEVDPLTLAITAETAAPCINENTALILGVHPIVNCCDVEGLETLSARTGIPLLFDAVESVYETYRGRKVGSAGKAECFSMQSSKLFNAFEGGYVTTHDAALATRLRDMRNLGLRHDGTLDPIGIGARQNEMHAAMALAAIDDVEDQILRNRHRYRAYQRLVPTVPDMRLLKFDETERCGYKNIVVELLDGWPVKRAHVLAILHAEHMLSRPYYSPALHQKRVDYPTVASDLSATELLAERFLMLPCGHFVDESDIETIVALLSFIHAHAAEINQRFSS
ncbi:aminotransferase class I/II-fold pyridoxal phosphate-dependent enzyme [Paraburkholderia madseniana]|uniref:aminotransferase class I/II-fold pyridoxal phosphate-dependent enzyme n=1 Tax=Paraburkholderia madseniana TaxID=2599607 RepID=UPI0038BB4BE3